MEEKQKIPIIRFKDFKDKWTNKRVSEIANVGTGYPFNSTLFSINGKYLVITNSNIQDDSQAVDKSVGNRIDLLDPIFKNFVLKKGEILVTMDGTVGRSAMVFDLNQILAQRVGRLSSKDSNHFLYYLLNTGKFSSEMTKLSKGGTIKHISLSDIGRYNSFVPKETEQTQIGNFFKTLDEQINLQEQKHQKLVNLKKAMLEKMFPKEGADTPEIRFKGFTEKWKKYHFKDNIIDIHTGTNLLGKQTNKGMPLVKMGNLQRGYFTFEKLEYLNSKDLVEPKDIVRKGDFLFNTRNTLELVGKGATWFGDDSSFAFNNNIARFTFKGINTYFFNYLYNTAYLLKQVRGRAMGTTSVAAIYPNNLMSITYYLPSLEEQQKIGDYFENLDNLIQQAQLQLEKHKNIKQALLQKMFV